MPYNTNFIVNINGQNIDLGTLLYKWNTNVINIPASGTTLGSYTINYTSPTIIRESDISVTMDGQPVNGDQVYTFGPLIQSRTVILGQSTGTGNSVVFSNDGFQFNGTGTTQIPASTGAIGLCFDGIKWVTSHQSGAKYIGYSYNGINWQTSGTISPTANYPWRIAYNGRIYILLVQGTPTAIYYSYDGFNWTQTTSPFSIHVMNIAWNGNFWLAVGSGANSIASSSNGINWTGSAPFSTLGSDICWIGNKWVITANNSGGTPIISYNTNPSGQGTWTTSNTTLFTTSGGGEQNVSFAWNGKILIASGVGGNTFAYSADGITWTGLGSLIYTAGTPLYPKSLWNGRLFINGYAQGNQANLFATSTNGTNWIGQGNIIFPYDIGANSRRMNSVTFQRNMTICYGINAIGTTGNTMIYSLDGINWNPCNAKFDYGDTYAYYMPSIGYNGKLWLNASIGTGDIYGNAIAASRDGINWYGLGYLGIAYYGTTIVWLGNKWLFGSWYNNIMYSYDGFTWIINNINRKMSICNGYAYNGSVYVGAGGGTGSDVYSLAYSYNGINWVGVPNSQTLYGRCHSPVSNGKIFVAITEGGGGISGYYIIYSYDGINWYGASTPWTGVRNAFYTSIATNGSMFVATAYVSGSINGIGYSYDGINWFASPAIGNLICRGGSIMSVTWNGSLWILVGSANTISYPTTNHLAYSYNGINWIASPTKNTFTGNATSTGVAICVFSNYGVKPIPFIQHPTLAFGSGTNTISYSPDGISWTGLGKPVFSTAGYCGFWSGSFWLAGGQGGNTMAFSYDGVQWSGISNVPITTAVQGITYNGTIWVATGSGGNSIAYSSDGFNWTGLNVIGLTTGSSVYWNGTVFLITSIANTFNYNSPDGIIWTRTGGSTFNGIPASNGITWVYPRNTTSLYYSNDPDGNQNTYSLATPAIFTTSGNCICYGGFIWLAGGKGGNTLAYSYNGFFWTGLGTTAFPTVCSSICWNGTRYVGAGGNYIGYSADGITWYSAPTSLFTSINYVVSNPGIGAFVAPSAMVLNNSGITGNGMSSSQTLEVVSSDPYFQSGFTNVSFNITSNSIMKP